MTSSNGNIFRVTGHLCAEFTGPGEFPAQRPVTRGFDVFFDLCPNKRLSKQPWGWWFETPSWSLWSHCNELTPTFDILPDNYGIQSKHTYAFVSFILFCLYHLPIEFDMINLPTLFRVTSLPLKLLKLPGTSKIAKQSTNVCIFPVVHSTPPTTQPTHPPQVP